MENIIIREIQEKEIQEAIELVWKVFLEYEAPDYTQEGILEFKKTINDNEWIKNRRFIGAFENDKIIGVIATKDSNHIALFFVDGNYHRKGIGKSLYNFIKEANSTGYFTVNSSPYAHEVYKRLGFVDTNEKQNVNGLIFYPMINNKLKKEIEIYEYNEKYAKEISDIVLSNLYKINIKEQGIDVIDRLAKHFTKDEIKKNFQSKTKCFIAIKNGEVVGTASINKSISDKLDGKYIIQTVFVKIEKHNQGIGKKLIEKIEEYAKSIDAKELIIPSSIYGLEFYLKLGYNYLGGKKELNEDREYILVKYL